MQQIRSTPAKLPQVALQSRGDAKNGGSGKSSRHDDSRQEGSWSRQRGHGASQLWSGPSDLPSRSGCVLVQSRHGSSAPTPPPLPLVPRRRARQLHPSRHNVHGQIDSARATHNLESRFVRATERPRKRDPQRHLRDLSTTPASSVSFTGRAWRTWKLWKSKREAWPRLVVAVDRAGGRARPTCLYRYLRGKEGVVIVQTAWRSDGGHTRRHGFGHGRGHVRGDQIHLSFSHAAAGSGTQADDDGRGRGLTTDRTRVWNARYVCSCDRGLVGRTWNGGRQGLIPGVDDGMGHEHTDSWASGAVCTCMQ